MFGSKRLGCLLCVLLAVAVGSGAQDWKSYQKRLENIAESSGSAVLPIVEFRDDAPPAVRGSAFLIDAGGYFLTAAHVVEPQPPSGTFSVSLRLKGGGGMLFQPFDVLEKDDRLDIALCKIRYFREAVTNHTNRWEWSALELSERPPRTGHLVVIAGFPLGSLNVSIQAGHIAANHTIFLSDLGVFDLFQVSVAGNQGDSGGPVIDLENKKVVGVIVKGSFNVVSNSGGTAIQSSGLLYAVSVSKIREWLARLTVQQLDYSGGRNGQEQ